MLTVFFEKAFLRSWIYTLNIFLFAYIIFSSHLEFLSRTCLWIMGFVANILIEKDFNFLLSGLKHMRSLFSQEILWDIAFISFYTFKFIHTALWRKFCLKISVILLHSVMWFIHKQWYWKWVGSHFWVSRTDLGHNENKSVV